MVLLVCFIENSQYSVNSFRKIVCSHVHADIGIKFDVLD